MIQRPVADPGDDAVLPLEGAGVMPPVLLAADGKAQRLEAAHQRRGVDHVREPVELLRSIGHEQGPRTKTPRGKTKTKEATKSDQDQRAETNCHQQPLTLTLTQAPRLGNKLGQSMQASPHTTQNSDGGSCGV